MEYLTKTKFVKTIVLLYKQVKNEDINLSDGELTDVLFYTLFDCFLKENGIDWRELLNINDDNLQARYPDFAMAIKEICKNYRFDYDEGIKNSEIITPRYLSFIQEGIYSIQKNNDGLTKRQLTGAFYTPELIVNYMVNESLQLYLQNEIQNFNCYNIFQSEKLNITPFDKETLDLNNLYNIRILDPAVGTGNFIVNLLEKLTTLLFFQSQHDIERFNIKNYLIENCLFGIDIQRISIEISKFRLLCSLLKENQNKKEPLLKNISFNLFVYDTLKIKKPTIGLFDINNLNDKEANIEKLYSILNNEGGFDIVLGNPPYINLQYSFNGGTTLYNYYKKDGLKTITGTGDIYVLFYEKGLHLLKKNGILCFLTSNKWIRSDYGIPLQKLLSQYNIYKFINLNNQMFKSTRADLNILLLINQNKHNTTEAINLKNINKEIKDYSQLINLISTKSLKIKDFAKNGWIIGNDNVIKLKNKVEKYGERLRGWEIKFFGGLKPPLHKIFLVTTKTKDDLLQNCRDEEERERTASIIKPVLRGRDIKRYFYRWDDLWLLLINPKYIENYKNGIDFEDYLKKNYPTLYEHLSKFRDGHPIIISGLKFFENIRYNKILYSKVNKFSKFCIDSKQIYFTDSVYSIITDNYQYLCGVLNSSLSRFFEFCYTGGGFKNKNFQFKKNIILSYPIPSINNDNIHYIKRIETLVDIITRTKFENNTIDTTELEEEIDDIVYKLYNLKTDEINFIRSKDWFNDSIT